jgi:fructokinase
MGTLGLAYPKTREAMEQAATLIKTQGGQIVIDLNWRPTFWPNPSVAPALLQPWLAQADWLKLSADEAIPLFGTARVQDLRARFPKVKGVVVTDGARGCEYVIAEYQGTVPAFAVPAQETTGAGDAFLAGLVYGLYRQGWQVSDRPTLERILTLASAMGALTTLGAGAIAAQPTPSDLQTFLQAQTGEAWAL